MEGTYRGREIGQWAKFAIFNDHDSWHFEGNPGHLGPERNFTRIFETDFSFSYEIFYALNLRND